MYMTFVSFIPHAALFICVYPDAPHGFPKSIIGQPRRHYIASHPCRSLVAYFFQHDVLGLASSLRLSLAFHA